MTDGGPPTKKEDLLDALRLASMWMLHKANIRFLYLKLYVLTLYLLGEKKCRRTVVRVGGKRIKFELDSVHILYLVKYLEYSM